MPTQSTRHEMPLILVRGFGGIGVEDDKKIAYQGFNDGTVYPQKRGENYIYEGLILRFMKSGWKYQDATNVVGYYGSPQAEAPQIPPELIEAGFPADLFSGSKLVIDPAMALSLLEGRSIADPRRTLWVFRYYDLDDRQFPAYGSALVRLIDFIQKLVQIKDQRGGATRDGAAKETAAKETKVNIIAHSMGGLIVRHAVQQTYRQQNRRAEDFINKIVTLGTPHQGISYQVFQNWIKIEAEKELEAFNPAFQKATETKDDNGRLVPNYDSFLRFGEFFPTERLLTVVGTNFRTYAIAPSNWLNRLFSAPNEFGPNYNRSDGLVKQAFAQIPGAPRTFVHKCHGGWDSLVTARESFEVATRFFFGDVRARLRLVTGSVTRGKDLFGKSEFFLGVSIKPRRVDFDLFHQSAEAENCYGPFGQTNREKAIDFSDDPAKLAFGWAGDNRLIWEGWLDTSQVLPDPSTTRKDMVLRLDFYIGERDLFGIGFSDNVVFRKQYYVRALLPNAGQPLEMYLHADERFASGTKEKPFVPDPQATIETANYQRMTPVDNQPGAWQFPVKGTGFAGVFQVEIDHVPLQGNPEPFAEESATIS